MRLEEHQQYKVSVCVYLCAIGEEYEAVRWWQKEERVGGEEAKSKITHYTKNPKDPLIHPRFLFRQTAYRDWMMKAVLETLSLSLSDVVIHLNIL